MTVSGLTMTSLCRHPRAACGSDRAIFKRPVCSRTRVVEITSRFRDPVAAPVLDHTRIRGAPSGTARAWRSDREAAAGFRNESRTRHLATHALWGPPGTRLAGRTASRGRARTPTASLFDPPRRSGSPKGWLVLAPARRAEVSGAPYRERGAEGGSPEEVAAVWCPCGRGVTTLPRRPKHLRRTGPVASSPADCRGPRVVSVVRRQRFVRSPRRAGSSFDPTGCRAAARASTLQPPTRKRSAYGVGGQQGDAGAWAPVGSSTDDRAFKRLRFPQGAAPLFSSPGRGQDSAEFSARNRIPLGPLLSNSSGSRSRGRYRAVPRTLRETSGRSDRGRLGTPVVFRCEALLRRERRACIIRAICARHHRVYLRRTGALLNDRRGPLLLRRSRSYSARGHFSRERGRSRIRDGRGVPMPPECPSRDRIYGPRSPLAPSEGRRGVWCRGGHGDPRHRYLATIDLRSSARRLRPHEYAGRELGAFDIRGDSRKPHQSEPRRSLLFPLPSLSSPRRRARPPGSIGPKMVARELYLGGRHIWHGVSL